jgi:glucose/arabinose dehydrogenase
MADNIISGVRSWFRLIFMQAADSAPEHAMAFRRTIPALAILAVVAACGDSAGPAPADGLGLVPVDSGYDFSLFVTAPPGDRSRLLVVERGGRIRLRKNGVRLDSAFLNLTNLTSPATGEYGVYGLAFHPDYATNRRLFVYYADLNGDSQLAEYQADPGLDHADPASGQPVLNQTQDPGTVLYGGTVAFGPDGKLYLGLGDGRPTGSVAPTAQDSGSLLGKILRLDVDGAAPYAIPPDNPYVGRPGWRGEIWQLGFRNPWRWSFDRATGDLWIGDVGEDVWEELDYLPGPVVGGNNFGWPFLEGNQCFLPPVGCDNTGLIPPVLEYAHGPSCAITGGHVYRGRKYPALRGTYVYGDFCSGFIRAVRLVGAQLVQAYTPLSPPLVNDNVVSFGEDADGEIHVVMASGRLYRLVLGSEE